MNKFNADKIFNVGSGFDGLEGIHQFKIKQVIFDLEALFNDFVGAISIDDILKAVETDNKTGVHYHLVKLVCSFATIRASEQHQSDSMIFANKLFSICMEMVAFLWTKGFKDTTLVDYIYSAERKEPVSFSMEGEYFPYIEAKRAIGGEFKSAMSPLGITDNFEVYYFYLTSYLLKRFTEWYGTVASPRTVVDYSSIEDLDL